MLLNEKKIINIVLGCFKSLHPKEPNDQRSHLEFKLSSPKTTLCNINSVICGKEEFINRNAF